MTTPLPIRVVIADDHPLVRAGVAAALSDPEVFLLIGQAKDSKETLELIQKHQPDLLILDLQMDDFRPVELIHSCMQSFGQLRILILSSRSEALDLAPLRDCGIHGFVAKEEGPDCLLQAVRVVMSGQSWFSHRVSRIFQQIREEARISPPPLLSAREREVLQGLVRAKDNQAIADEMQISKNTVRRYITQIFQKLDVKNRMEAVIWVNEKGLP